MDITVLVADITTLAVDAVVNAANPALLGGGGVDGAIHRAAGPRLLAACKALPETAPGVRCPTGQARITPGFALPARHVIHTVGPVWHGGRSNESKLLAQCYRSSLGLAGEHALDSIAFPAVSCGVYGFPAGAAAIIAVAQARAWSGARPRGLVFCCFDDAMASHYRRALAGIAGQAADPDPADSRRSA